jgi:hypothetical protein
MFHSEAFANMLLLLQPVVVLITADNDFCTLISRLENRDVDVQVVTRTLPGTMLYETSNAISWEDLIRGSDSTSSEVPSRSQPTIAPTSKDSDVEVEKVSHFLMLHMSEIALHTDCFRL